MKSNVKQMIKDVMIMRQSLTIDEELCKFLIRFELDKEEAKRYRLLLWNMRNGMDSELVIGRLNYANNTKYI